MSKIKDVVIDEINELRELEYETYERSRLRMSVRRRMV